MPYLEQVADMNNLLYGVKRIQKASGWKTSTQNFSINKLRNCVKLNKEIKNGTYRQSKGYSFILNEYGRKRKIKALNCADMVVQHSLCDFVLVPTLRRYLIYDNGASLKGKGLSFTRSRFETHLHKFYRKHGLNGYILFIDFRKFFDNIQHEKILQMYSKIFKEKEFIKFIENILSAYEIDTDGKLDDIYNALDNKGKQNHLRKSIGIGAPLSQITGIFFAHKIDNYCKTVKRLKYYGAYADDRYIIHTDKEVLHNILYNIKLIAQELGIHIHENKTQIIKLTRTFTFLQIRYIITKTGKIIKKLSKNSIKRQRKKMPKLVFKINKDEYIDWYRSWRGDKISYNAYYTIYDFDRRFWLYGNIYKQ